MTKVVINLTAPIVKEEIDCLLGAGSDPAYRGALENPDSRRELIAYVLSRAPNFYTVIDAKEPVKLNPPHLYCSLEQRLKIGVLIRQSIQQILQTQLDQTYAESAIPVSLSSSALT